jgi:hypothetical protein
MLDIMYMLAILSALFAFVCATVALARVVIAAKHK